MSDGIDKPVKRYSCYLDLKRCGPSRSLHEIFVHYQKGIPLSEVLFVGPEHFPEHLKGTPALLTKATDKLLYADDAFEFVLKAHKGSKRAPMSMMEISGGDRPPPLSTTVDGGSEAGFPRMGGVRKRARTNEDLDALIGDDDDDDVRMTPEQLKAEVEKRKTDREAMREGLK